MSSAVTPKQFAAMQQRVAACAAVRRVRVAPVDPLVKQRTAVAVTPGTRAAPGILAGMKIRDSKDVASLNKTEAAFLTKLRADKWPFVAVQSMTFKLGDDCRYTPDFITVDEGVIVAWEVKGFWRDDARVKIKTAARAYPFIQFIAVQRKGAAGWTEEDIAP